MEDRGLQIIDRPIVFFDLETTHLDVSKAKIVEIAAIKQLTSGKQLTLEKRIRPGCPIPAEATEVHGIKDEDLEDKPLFEFEAQEIYEFFEGCDLAGFNLLQYDIPVLSREFKTVGLILDVRDISVIDCKKIYHMREPRDLSSAVAFYTPEFHLGAHNAMADTKAVVKVLLGQLEMYSDLPTTPAGLYESTREKGSVTVDGKIAEVNGDLCFSFGKHKHEPLWSLAHHYLEWVLANVECGNDTARIIRGTLSRRTGRHRGRR